MKKTVAFLISIAMATSMAMAQKKVTVKAGTIIPLRSMDQVKAADVSEGDNVSFQVVANVMADGSVAVPQGAIARGIVTEAKKSSLAGTKGRLSIKLSNLVLPNGEQIYFSNSNIRFLGKNRTPLAVITCLFVFPPFIFIPGTKAVMPVGYETQAVVSANTEVTVQ